MPEQSYDQIFDRAFDSAIKSRKFVKVAARETWLAERGAAAEAIKQALGAVFTSQTRRAAEQLQNMSEADLNAMSPDQIANHLFDVDKETEMMKAMLSPVLRKIIMRGANNQFLIAGGMLTATADGATD